MAYEATAWKKGDVITSAKLNKLEAGVKNEQVGPAGEKGATGPAGSTGPAGVEVKAITLMTTDGKVTAGTATLTNDKTADITVTEKPAS